MDGERIWKKGWEKIYGIFRKILGKSIGIYSRFLQLPIESGVMNKYNKF